MERFRWGETRKEGSKQSARYQEGGGKRAR